MKREHNLTSALTGLLGISWAVAGTWPMPPSPWHILINSTENGELWLVLMITVGLLQVVGCPVRTYRHIGFYLGGIVWLSTFGLFFYRGIVTPGMITCAICGAFSFYALVDEVYTSVKYEKGKTHDFFATE